jgi:hypothetical protein
VEDDGWTIVVGFSGSMTPPRTTLIKSTAKSSEDDDIANELTTCPWRCCAKIET